MKQILFIDVRHKTRSRIAESWLNHLAAGCGVAVSCGTMPSGISDPRTVQVMKEVGLDASGRPPTMVNQQMLARADIVVLMGLDIAPQAFHPTCIWDFQEPIGRPLEEVRFLRDRIRLRVQRLIADIQVEHLESITTPLQWQTLMQYILS